MLIGFDRVFCDRHGHVTEHETGYIRAAFLFFGFCFAYGDVERV